MRARTSIITGTLAVLVLGIICVSAVSAIAPAQVAYSESLFGGTGTKTLTYTLEFHNRYTNTGDEPDPNYRVTVVVDATVTYSIVSINNTALNVTETISGFTVNYPYAVNASHAPYLAMYDQTVSKINLLTDFTNELYGGPVRYSEFLVANHSVQNQSLVQGSNAITTIVNQVIYHKNNTAQPISGCTFPGSIRNKFIVSSNITGSVTTSLSTGITSNAEGNTSTDKVYAHAFFYTPMSFAGQRGTFWLDMGIKEVTGMGLWTLALPNAPDASTFPMTYNEDETYTWHEGQSDEAFRWRSKYEVGYPKVGGTEQAKYDSATGFLLEYYSDQVRVDAKIGTTFYENMHPQSLKCTLTTISGQEFGGNASPEVPGFPLIAVLVSIGIGFALVYRKFRK